MAAGGFFPPCQGGEWWQGSLPARSHEPSGATLHVDGSAGGVFVAFVLVLAGATCVERILAETMSPAVEKRQCRPLE